MLCATALTWWMGQRRPSPARSNGYVTPPWTQRWERVDLITIDNDWSSVPGILGYAGADPAQAEAIDPRTITAGRMDATAPVIKANWRSMDPAIRINRPPANTLANTALAGRRRDALRRVQVGRRIPPLSAPRGGGTSRSPLCLHGHESVQHEYGARDWSS